MDPEVCNATTGCGISHRDT